LPIYYEMQENEVALVVDEITKFFGVTHTNKPSAIFV